ncbi:MAG: hypothetical protein WDN04_23360 [Rhodospirillales bacterium]
MRKLYFLAVLQALLLAGCISLGSGPAERTTVVVPPSNGTTVVCPGGGTAPC